MTSDKNIKTFFDNRLNFLPDNFSHAPSNISPQIRQVCQKVNIASDASFIFPIEQFKDESIPAFSDRLRAEMTFVSSGTSGQQSKVPFSPEGLKNYRLSAIRNFLTQLQFSYGDGFNKTKGICLIPTSDPIWSRSSLAQMLKWIAEIMPVKVIESRYGNPADQLHTLLCSSSSQSAYQDGLWIFGTALHFYQLLQSGKMFALPAAISSKLRLFETGGFKASGVSLSKPKLYEKLAKTFGISSRQIISEYGMAELASQAYDNPDDPGSSVHRGFTFPPWVQPAVYQGEGMLKDEGIGLLCVHDNLRSDMPVPIKTQDIVHLSKNGRFRYLQRLPHAAPKGCSNLVDTSDDGNFSPDGNATLESKGGMRFLKTPMGINKPENKPKAAKLVSNEAIKEFFNDAKTRQAFAKEIGSMAAAEEFLEAFQNHLVMDFPEENTSQEAIQVFLLPKNHSIAAMQNLLLSKLQSRRIAIKAPYKIGSAIWQESLIYLFVQEIIQPEWIFSGDHKDTLDFANWLKRKQNAAIQINMMGSDANAQAVRDTFSKPPLYARVEAAGDQRAVNLVSLNAFRPKSMEATCQKIVRDAFHLAQRGCRCARMLIVETPAVKQPSFRDYFESIAEKIIHGMHRAFAEFWQAEIPLEDRLIIDGVLDRLGWNTPAAANKKAQNHSNELISYEKIFLRAHLATNHEVNWDQFWLPSNFSLPIVFTSREIAANFINSTSKILIGTNETLTQNLSWGDSAKEDHKAVCPEQFRPLGEMQY